MREHDPELRLWSEIEQARKTFDGNRLLLGKLFYELRNLYSERNSGGGRLTSGRGQFEEKIKERGYKPRRVREWINDYEVERGLRPAAESTAAKRKSRRSNSAEYQRGFNAAIRSTHAGIEDDPLTRLFELLPSRERQNIYRDLQAAVRLQERHLDHGDVECTRELIAAWEAVVERHFSEECTEGHGTVPVPVSAYTQ